MGGEGGSYENCSLFKIQIKETTLFFVPLKKTDKPSFLKLNSNFYMKLEGGKGATLNFIIEAGEKWTRSQ